MKTILSLVLSLTGLASFGQNLKTFKVTMNPDSTSYLSIKNNKAYTSVDANSVKTDLDLGLFVTITDKKDDVIEWYNLKPDNDKVPPHLTGTKTAIAAISFDRDQFDKCKTTADIKRMTGHITKNSFSHFAVIRNSPDTYQRCFIVEKEDGKRGLLFLTEVAKSTLMVEIKTE